MSSIKKTYRNTSLDHHVQQKVKIKHPLSIKQRRTSVLFNIIVNDKGQVLKNSNNITFPPFTRRRRILTTEKITK